TNSRTAHRMAGWGFVMSFIVRRRRSIVNLTSRLLVVVYVAPGREASLLLELVRTDREGVLLPARQQRRVRRSLAGRAVPHLEKRGRCPVAEPDRGHLVHARAVGARVGVIEL